MLPLSTTNQPGADPSASRSAGMAGRGQLTMLRTARDGDRVLVEIGDNGPRHPRDSRRPRPGALLHPKPVGKGTGLGLDICWRIRRPAPPRRPAVHSHPGDTHFQVVVLTRAGDPRAQTGSRRSPPWAATAQITKMSRVMMSSDQNG